MANWVTGKVSHIERWTEGLFSLYVHAPIEPFIAGQFAKLALDINGERIQRAYSYVNAPDSDCLEFYLVDVKEGRLSPKLAQLQPGDDILITEQASGFFILDEIPECDDLWMLSTGTAIGPYLSILQYEKQLERFKHIVLVHAVRFSEDLSYLPLMKQLQQKLGADKLRIQTVVSRETTAESLSGRIPALIESGELEDAVGLKITPETSHIMLCGNPQMVRDTQNILKTQKALTKHLRRKPGHITTEQYW